MLIVAADQRNGMKAAIKDAPNGSDAISREELAEVKADLVRHLANHAPAILLDPEVALPRIVDDGVLARDTALVVGLDASGAETVDGLKYTRYVPGTTPHSIREQGADVAKMLWYTRPDKQDADSRVAHEIRDLVQACEAEGLLLIVELLTYQLEGESDEEYRAKFADLVVDGPPWPSRAARRSSSCSTPAPPRRAPRDRGRPGRAVGRALGRRRPRDVHRAGAHGRRQRRLGCHGRSVAVEGQPLDRRRPPRGAALGVARRCPACASRRRGRRTLR